MENLRIERKKRLDKETARLLKLLLFFPISMLVLALYLEVKEAGTIVAAIKNIASGVFNLTQANSLLTTDYFAVSGVVPSLVNSALIALLNLLIIRLLRIQGSGLMLAAFFNVLGFAFIGKNIVNILPIYLGGFLYSRVQKIRFGNVFLVSMFATALSPLLSLISNSNIFFNHWTDVLAAAALGTVVGFFIMPVSSSMLKFHEGYSLYNVGFTAGIVGTVITSVLRGFDHNLEPQEIISNLSPEPVILLFYLFAVYLLLCGIGHNWDVAPSYKRLLRFSGRSVTDFTVLLGFDYALFNMGVMGLIALSFILLAGGDLNGLTIASVCNVMGFAAFGKHPVNSLPVMLGAYLAATFYKYDAGSNPMLMAVLFSTNLAPISGTYGPIWGFFSGMLHIGVVVNIAVIQGGINLHNNGFAGGLVAGLMVPIIAAVKMGWDKNRKRRRK